MKSTPSTLHVARSVERALSLLEVVVSGNGITLTDAARAVDIPTSTALRHLRALEIDGYVVRGDDTAFEAGPRFVRLALTALDNAPAARLAQLARPLLIELEVSTEESAYLAVPEDGEHAVYVATQESRRAIRHVGWLGTQVSRHGTAVGEALSGRVRSGTAVARIGAVEPDVTAVASPVLGRDGSVVAALAVIGPTERLAGEALDRAKAAVARVAEGMNTTEVVR
jgi:IclR family acetate operon transcriptional repressor